MNTLAGILKKNIKNSKYDRNHCYCQCGTWLSIIKLKGIGTIVLVEKVSLTFVKFFGCCQHLGRCTECTTNLK
jgi:hypothetical protein